MQTKHEFLVEIFTEELPPKALLTLAQDFKQHIVQTLFQQGLINTADTEENSVLASPRRLAVYLKNVLGTQPDQMIEKKGPALQAAFDSTGLPTKAAEGFAKSCHTTVDKLEKLETEQGSWLVFRETQKGKTAKELLPLAVTQSLDALPIPKRMRWGNRDIAFVRPAHNVLMLLDNDVIDCEILGLETNNTTYGHRFHHPEAISISKPSEYEDKLYQAKVTVNFEKRQKNILEQINKAASRVQGKACIDSDLLNEVTSLVEWPVALTVPFEKRFLSVPKEALISSMQHHQKCFAIVNEKEELLPLFITLSNLESKNVQTVIDGNARVMQARLSDAAFFYEQDKKERLEARLERLKSVVFQIKLGSLFDKTKRVEKLTEYLATQCKADIHQAKRAALLSKADLMTAMVGEFPELQGIMGEYYALHDGEEKVAAKAIADYYKPRFSGDTLPESAEASCLAIADRLDTLIGIFGINQQPSGSKDPFALRRAALGIIRICIEKNLPFNLEDICTYAEKGFSALANPNTAQEVIQFILERLKYYYQEKEISSDRFNAVVNQSRVLSDLNSRINAIQIFVKLPQAAALSEAHKRVGNILEKYPASTKLDPTLLKEEAEKNLYLNMQKKQHETETLSQHNKYAEVLHCLAELHEPVTQFFDQVMVIAEDTSLRHNRLALLRELADLFLQVADISQLNINSKPR